MQSYYFNRAYYGNEPTPEKTFTQQEVNSMLADNKRGLQDKLNQATIELDKLKGVDTKALQSKIEELSSSLLTKDELAKQTIERTKAEAEAKLAEITNQNQAWRNRHDQVLVKQELAAAAMKHNAFDAEQIMMLFGASAKAVEVTDNEGKGTGQFKVVLPTTIEGKPVELDADQAVARLREDKRYGNLFKANGNSGAGLIVNTAGADSGSDEIPTDSNAYFAKRAYLKGKGII